MHRSLLGGPWGRNVHWIVLALVTLGTANRPALAQRDLAEIPKPDPVAELAAMKAADGAAVNLYAADPDIRKPIQINFDSRGRLWVASSEVYPQIKPGEIANDKILVLQDSDGDGVCDISTVFAEGLLIPTGVLPDELGGAYVAASTELLHFADTDGDGKADKRRVVLSGFGTEDTHHLIHTLRWGPDGCLYFNQSIYIHSHIETAFGTRHLDGGGIWRYRPETGELSVVSRGLVNPWGHAFDAHGESFATDGAGSEGINYVFPDSVFVTSPGEVRWLPGMNPGSPKHCGLEVISGSHFPEAWWGDLVTSDFRGHRVCRFTIRPSGSHFTSRQQPEIVTSSHIAFRPIDARLGPDGALYIADWYNPIIQHGEVDFRDERRDRERGRIWRVHFPDRTLETRPDFAAAPTEKLLELLEHRSLAVRQFARQHLWLRVREPSGDVLTMAARWRDASPDTVTSGTRALEHQWLGEVAGRFARESFEIVSNAEPSPVSRTSLRSAIRSAGHSDPLVAARLIDAAVGDHAPSRLEAVVALGQVDAGAPAVKASETLIAVAQRMGEDGNLDPVLDFVIWQSLRKLSGTWVEALRENRLKWQPNGNGLAYAVTAASNSAAADAVTPLLSDENLDEGLKRSLIAAIAVSGDPSTLGKLLSLSIGKLPAERQPEALSAIAVNILERLIERSGRDRTVPQDAARLLQARFPTPQSLPMDSHAKNVVIAAVGQWNVAPLIDTLLELAAADEPGDSLIPAIRALGKFDSAPAKNELSRWASQGNKLGNPAAAIEATAAMVPHQPDRAAEAAVGLLAELSDQNAANQLLLALRPNQAIAAKIAEQMADVVLPTERAQALLSAVRNAGGNELLEKAIHSSGRLDKVGWEWTPELAAEVLTASTQRGVVGRGETVYRRISLQCINCHAIGSAGGLVGPNLISLGSSSQPDYILESLLVPDARLKEGYNTLSVLTDDGRATSGIPIGRTDSSLRLRLADGQEVEIPQDTIEQEQPGKSLMPAGLVDSLTKDELIDLVTFLRALGRDPAFTVSTEPIVRGFEMLTFTKDAHQRLNRTSTDSAATDDPAFQWRPITTRVSGTLPIDELDGFKQHGNTPLTSFVRFSVVIPDGQPAPRIELPTEGVTVWVDGKPTPVQEINTLKLSSGTHRVVVSVNREALKEDFRVRLVPAPEGN